MPDKRKAYAPFSLITESGVSNAPVEGYIDVNQEIQPTVSTGTVNENGVWTGVKSDDTGFIGISKAVELPNTGETLFPDTGNLNFIDMTGFKNLYIAIKPTRGGNVDITAVMGPDTNRFANLEPVNAAAQLRGVGFSGQPEARNLFNDDSEALTADVWNIFYIGADTLAGQKNMQFKVTNNAGGNSDIEFGFMRLV